MQIFSIKKIFFTNLINTCFEAFLPKRSALKFIEIKKIFAFKKILPMKPIITATELSEIFNQENLVILDARTGKDARENYLQNHIKGARFIDLDKDLAEIGEDAAFGGRHPCQRFQNLQRLYKS